MKRLYVAPEAAASASAATLVSPAVIAAAERDRLSRDRLDTLPGMADAIALYRARGLQPLVAPLTTPHRTGAGTALLSPALRYGAGDG